MIKTLETLATNPNKSLPAMVESDAELEAIYRLMNNQWVSFEDLMAEQAAGTAERAAAAKQVLVIHDTTKCQFKHADPAIIGHLPTGKPGFFVHTSLVVDMNEWRRPLGVVHAETIHRAQRSGRGSRKKKARGDETATWKHRESERWWRGIEASEQELGNCDRVIHVADREGDSYALLAAMVTTNKRFVVRVRHKARTAREPGAEAWSSINHLVDGITGRFTRDIPLAPRQAKVKAPNASRTNPPRKARTATLQFSAKQIEIKRPRYIDDRPSTICVNVVHVRELSLPDGVRPVEWLLVTTEPIDTASDVAAVVDIYCARWLTEEFYSALKTGCLYEHRRFESKGALRTLLAMCFPIANELLWLRSRVRTNPDAPATEVLSPTHILVLDVLGPRTLSADPTVGEVFRVLAEFGGHQRQNGPPGWKILKRAMVKLNERVVGWKAAMAHRQNL